MTFFSYYIGGIGNDLKYTAQVFFFFLIFPLKSIIEKIKWVNFWEALIIAAGTSKCSLNVFERISLIATKLIFSYYRFFLWVVIH